MSFHFALLAPLYDRLFPNPNLVRLRELLGLPVAGWMLDAGGGTGRVSAHLRPGVGGLVLSDLSGAMLRRARSKGDLCPVQAGVERLPFPDGCFERVLVVDALHHFQDQMSALCELLRVLKPGGRMVIEELDVRYLPARLVALVEKLTLMGSHFLSPPQIATLIATHGFASREVSDGRFTTWVIVDRPGISDQGEKC